MTKRDPFKFSEMGLGKTGNSIEAVAFIADCLEKLSDRDDKLKTILAVAALHDLPIQVDLDAKRRQERGE